LKEFSRRLFYEVCVTLILSVIGNCQLPVATLLGSSSSAGCCCSSFLNQEDASKREKVINATISQLKIAFYDFRRFYAAAFLCLAGAANLWLEEGSAPKKTVCRNETRNEQ